MGDPRPGRISFESGCAQVPENVRLPPYSLEFNPTERAGLLIRAATGNRVFSGLVAQKAAIEYELRRCGRINNA